MVVPPENPGADFAPYIAHLAHEKRLSELTRKHYRRDLDALKNLAEKRELTTLSQQDIRRFVATMHSRGLGSRSLARMLSSWRGYFHYAVEHGLATQNPVVGLRPPKADKHLPQALSPEQAMQLVSIDDDTVSGIRDHAIYELLYSSGLRVSELTNLDVDKLDTANAEVRVTGKGNKTRIVPVGRAAIDALTAWLTTRATLPAANSTALFLGPRGTRISPRLVQLRIKSWASKQGLDVALHPHMLRHSFASHVLQSSGDLCAVQEMLGHTSIASTQVYTHLDFQHLAKVYDAAHPRAKKKLKMAKVRAK